MLWGRRDRFAAIKTARQRRAGPGRAGPVRAGPRRDDQPRKCVTAARTELTNRLPEPSTNSRDFDAIDCKWFTECPHVEQRGRYWHDNVSCARNYAKTAHRGRKYDDARISCKSRDARMVFLCRAHHAKVSIKPVDKNAWISRNVIKLW